MLARSPLPPSPGPPGVRRSPDRACGACQLPACFPARQLSLPDPIRSLAGPDATPAGPGPRLARPKSSGTRQEFEHCDASSKTHMCHHEPCKRTPLPAPRGAMPRVVRKEVLFRWLGKLAGARQAPTAARQASPSGERASPSDWQVWLAGRQAWSMLTRASVSGRRASASRGQASGMSRQAIRSIRRASGASGQASAVCS